MSEGRLPPYSAEAESGVLGCILLDSKTSIPKLLEAEPISGSLFYDNRKLAVWDAMCELFNAELSIDVLTLSSKLRARGQLEQVGGVQGLMALSDNVPSVINVDSYLSILQEKHLLRQVLAQCATLTGLAFEEQPAAEVIERAQTQFLRIGAEHAGTSFQPVRDLLKASMQELQELSDKSRRITGLASGFNDLDFLTGGFQPGEVTIVAARPSVGKSAIALNIATHVAEQGGAVGLFSLEMTSRTLTNRLIASTARVNLRHVMTGAATEEELTEIKHAFDAIRKLPIYIDDTSRSTITQLRSKAVQLHAEKKLALVIIDYLQLVRGMGRDNRAQEVGDVSAGIRAIAKDLGVPIVALAQLSRDVEKEKGREPRLSDLRESGQIEADADAVLLMHRPSDGDEESRNAYSVKFNLAKHRNGPTGRFKLVFLPGVTRFEDAPKVEETQAELPTAKPVNQPYKD